MGAVGATFYISDLYSDFTSYDNVWDIGGAVICDSLGFWGPIGVGSLVVATAPASAPALLITGVSIGLGALIGWGADALKQAWLKRN